jgi:hypothetical protein
MYAPKHTPRLLLLVIFLLLAGTYALAQEDSTKRQEDSTKKKGIDSFLLKQKGSLDNWQKTYWLTLTRNKLRRRWNEMTFLSNGTGPDHTAYLYRYSRFWCLYL